jgi:hypothetical protein
MQQNAVPEKSSEEIFAENMMKDLMQVQCPD